MERYLALDRHFARTKSPHMGFSTRRTFFYIAVILAFTVAFNMPAIFEHEVWEHQPVLYYLQDYHTEIHEDFSRNVFLAQTVDAGDHLEVTPTALRFNEVYVKMYKLMAEFLVSSTRPLVLSK